MGCHGLILILAGLAMANPPTETLDARARLAKLGVEFKQHSLLSYFIYRDGQQNVIPERGVWVGVNDFKLLKKEDLRLLTQIPELKEVGFEVDLPDGWLAEIRGIKTLEGLFFRGNFNFDQGIGDQDAQTIGSFPNLLALSLLETRISDKGVSELRNLKKLKVLTLSGCRNVTDKGIEALSGLTELQDLNLDHTSVTRACLRHLEGLTKLRRFSLSFPSDDKSAGGLKYLRKMKELRELNARKLCAGDDDLEAAVELTELRELDLTYTDVTDKGLKHLSRLKHLRVLDLFGTKVEGPGLAHLVEIKSLRHLVLGRTLLDERALEHLRKMDHLASLEVSDSGLSPQEIRELKKALPKTKIE